MNISIQFSFGGYPPTPSTLKRLQEIKPMLVSEILRLSVVDYNKLLYLMCMEVEIRHKGWEFNIVNVTKGLDEWNMLVGAEIELFLIATGE